jgi:hypothetical protein
MKEFEPRAPPVSDDTGRPPTDWLLKRIKFSEIKSFSGKAIMNPYYFFQKRILISQKNETKGNLSKNLGLWKISLAPVPKVD